MKRIKRLFLHWAIRSLYKGITKNDIKIHSRDKAEVRMYVEDAKYIQKMKFWNWLIGEMTEETTKMLYLKAKTEEDMIFGKACLHTIQMMKDKINDLAKIKV